MTNIRIKMTSGSRFKLRSAPKVVDFLEAVGAMLTEEANKTIDSRDGYRMSSNKAINFPYGHWMVNVYTYSNRAKRSNAANNTLLSLLKEQ